MAVFSLTVPPAVTQRVVDAFTNQYGYQAAIPDPANPGGAIPNPETPAAFVKRMLSEHIKNVVKSYEATVAENASRQAAVAKVDAEISIT